MTPFCPNCGSQNVLPHEEESEGIPDLSISWIIILGLIIIGIYLMIIITSYLYYPVIIFIIIAIISIIMNDRKFGSKKKKKEKEITYICLDCNINFSGINKNTT